MQIDRWYLERRIYLAVGINISIASILVLAVSPWLTLFTLFVGGAMVWFAATGYCIMANALYWLGAEPRLNPEAMPSGRCANCAMAPVCISHSARNTCVTGARFRRATELATHLTRVNRGHE